MQTVSLLLVWLCKTPARAIDSSWRGSHGWVHLGGLHCLFADIASQDVRAGGSGGAIQRLAGP